MANIAGQYNTFDFVISLQYIFYRQPTKLYNTLPIILKKSWVHRIDT